MGLIFPTHPPPNNMPGGPGRFSLSAGLEDMSAPLQQLLTLSTGSTDEIDAVHGLLRSVLPNFIFGLRRHRVAVATKVEHLVTVAPGTSPLLDGEPHVYVLVLGTVYTVHLHVARVELLRPRDLQAGSDIRVLFPAVFVLACHWPGQPAHRVFFSTKQLWDHRAGSPEILFPRDVTSGMWHNAWIKIALILGLDWNFIPSSRRVIGAHLRVPSLGRLRSSTNRQVGNCKFDSCRS